MNQVRNSVVFLVALLLLANGAFNFAWANHDEHREKKWNQKILDDDTNHDDDDENDDDIPPDAFQRKLSTPYVLPS